MFTNPIRAGRLNVRYSVCDFIRLPPRDRALPRSRIFLLVHLLPQPRSEHATIGSSLKKTSEGMGRLPQHLLESAAEFVPLGRREQGEAGVQLAQGPRLVPGLHVTPEKQLAAGQGGGVELDRLPTRLGGLVP